MPQKNVVKKKKLIDRHIYVQMPFLRLLLGFIGGVLFEIFVRLEIGWFVAGFSVCMITLILFEAILLLRISFSYAWINGVGVVLLMFNLGGAFTYLKTQENRPNHFAKIDDPKSVYIVRVDDPLFEKATSYKTTLAMQWRSQDGKLIPVSGKCLCYLKKDSLSAKLNYGDQLVIKATINEIEGPQNPEEFNYKRYLYFHQIYHQVYLKSDSYQVINHDTGSPILSFALSMRMKLVELLKRYIPEKRNNAVASALVVGYDDEIDNSLIQAFASAGALHVLSVSGMHVALMYQLLMMLLGLILVNRKYDWIKFTIAIIFLWCYALITGYTPSVLRAVVMFNFIIVAQWTTRNTSTFNTICVSIFFLMLFDPFIITEVGFQLSYLAVIGIVYLHPKISNWWTPSNWLLKQIWTITAVSLAAQLATFPLGLLYFHQFPLLFVVSNLLVIPLTTIIIYACLVLLVISPIAVIANYAGLVISALLSVTNEIVFFIDRIPGAVLNKITINIGETWLIYLIMILLIAVWVSKQMKYLVYGLAFSLLFLVLQVYESFEQMNQRKFMVYAVNKHSAYQIVNSRKHIFIADSNLLADKGRLLFHIYHHWWAIGTQEQLLPMHENFKSDLLLKNDNLCATANKLIYQIRSNKDKISLTKRIDYCIVSNNAFYGLKNTLDNTSPELVIIDKSNSRYQSDRMEKLLSEKKVKFYNVYKQGYFETNL
ncbi:MAG: ComEC family competence protein [Bacteroidetes bacterium]|nr:ComEC family competence protein [Bacteroidota bacterium]